MGLFIVVSSSIVYHHYTITAAVPIKSALLSLSLLPCQSGALSLSLWMAFPETNDGLTESAAGEREMQWKGHALVMPWSAQGHINPMMHLSHRLAAHDVLVTFVITKFNYDRVVQSRSSSDPQHGNIRVVGLDDGMGYDEHVAKFNLDKQAQALIDSEPRLVKLVEEAQPPVTCIIADVFVIITPAVARRFNVPHVTFWTQSAANYACNVFFLQNHSSLKEYLEKLSSEGKEDERGIYCVPSCPPMRYKDVPTFLLPCDPSDICFSCLIKMFQSACHNQLVLMNTFEQLEEESLAYIHSPNLICIGPVLPPHYILSNDDPSSHFGPRQPIPTVSTSFWVEDGEGCLPWLHRQKLSSVLYVSFGSITLMSAQQAVEFAGGLEASGCPFLMVVRPEMMEGGGSITFPDGFVDKMRGSGQATFVAWAPQLEVLAHPAIGGFLTHAGWNSILESLCKGVPMLCWPYFGDQMLNSRCIVDTWQIGLDFITKKVSENGEMKGGKGVSIDSTSIKDGCSEEVSLVTREEIEQKIRLLMDPLTSIEIRKKINNLRLAAQKAYENASHSSFQQLLDVVCH